MEEKELRGKIRFASPRDAGEILGIYAPYVENTAISFEYTVPTKEEFRLRIEKIAERYPWIVYEEEAGILGYAYAGPDRERAAYQWTAESSVYVAPSARGRGIGPALYDVLFDILRKQNFCLCSAIITADNEASLKMHEKCGFYRVGFSESSGYKLGAWHGIVTMEKRLNPFLVPPKPVIPIGEIDFPL